jgi:xylulokinase
MLEILAKKGSTVHEVVAINGGARSPLWRQIFADVLQVPIRWRPESGGTLAGAAYLAALGAGNRSSFDDLAAWLEPTIDTTPTSAWQDHYLSQYEIFCQLYGRLQDFFPRLNRS